MRKGAVPKWLRAVLTCSPSPGKDGIASLRLLQRESSRSERSRISRFEGTLMGKGTSEKYLGKVKPTNRHAEVKI